MLVDLAAAYDTVWLRGLTLKLLKFIPSKQMVRFMLKLISNCYFSLQGNDDVAKEYQLKNGVPQGSMLAPTLFNIYTADLPIIKSKRYVYADDIANMHPSHSYSELEKTLNKDVNSL